jgi:hypothetical protein
MAQRLYRTNERHNRAKAWVKSHNFISPQSVFGRYELAGAAANVGVITLER